VRQDLIDNDEGVAAIAAVLHGIVERIPTGIFGPPGETGEIDYAPSMHGQSKNGQSKKLQLKKAQRT
jgi:hypothetical protein